MHLGGVAKDHSSFAQSPSILDGSYVGSRRVMSCVRPMIIKDKNLWSLPVVLMLSACQADGPASHVIAPRLPVEYSAQSISSNTKAKAILRWPDAFSDANISALVDRAMSSNLSIDQAKSRLMAARALNASALASFFPQATMTSLAAAGSGTTPKDDFSRRPVQLNLETGWEIPLFGQSRDTTVSADMETAMLETDVKAAKLAVAAEIAADYLHLCALQQMQLNNNAIIGLLEKSADIARNKRASGLSTVDSVDSVNAVLEEARSRQPLLKTSIQDTLQQIATLTGNALPDASLLSGHGQPAISAVAVREHPTDLLRMRPDVRRAQLLAFKAGAEVGLAQADLYPKLHLSGMVGIGSPVEGSLFGLMGGPSLQLPIFDYGRRKGVVAARRALFDEAISAYRQAVLTAYEEASSALRSFEDAKDRAAQARKQMEVANRAEARNKLLAHEGLIETQAYLESRIATLNRQRLLIECIESEGRAAIALYKAIGVSPELGSAGADAVSELQIKK